MLETNSNTRPIWFDSSVINKHPQQTGQISVDVCIVGGGMAGLSTAEALKRSGKTVAVIELGRIGGGETGHTTAHLTEVFDLDYRDLISNFGLEGARLAGQAARRSIDAIEETVSRLGINCGFSRVSGYQYTDRLSEVDEIEDEAQAALRAGVQNELLFETPLPYHIERAVRFDGQAQFNPLQYLAGLAHTIAGDGSYIFEETRMLDIVEGEPCKVTTDRGMILAGEVVVAANVPSSNRFFLQTKIAAYRTYAIAVRANNQFNHKNLFWDIGDPYHYIRSFEMNGVPHLIIGGEDHKTGQDDHTGLHFQKLEDWAHAHFNIETITHRWSGQVIEPVDGLPYIGKNALSDKIYVATGFSGNGMTFGTLSGLILSDLIIGKKNPYVELFDAGRVKPLAGFKNYISENIDFPSHLIGDRFASAQTSEVARIRENEGALVRMGGKKVAAYRDTKGELHLMSPVCPHLGCHVNWNEAEKSWDCPCHGARFNPIGQLLNGPAVSDLASETIDETLTPITERYDQVDRDLGIDALSGSILGAFSCPLKLRPN